MNYTDFCVDISTPVKQVLEVIEKTHMRAAVVVENGFLKGVVTDGDVRRYLLKNRDIGVSIEKVMCTCPIYLLEKEKDYASQCMKENRIQIVPIVNSLGKVIDIKFSTECVMEDDISQGKLENVPVVIMAGGKGRRLLPYTAILPKPLMPIAGKTILEHIIESLSKYGCNEYFLTLNYKKEIIKAYLIDADISCNIRYIEEKDYMGTAGSLGLIRDELKSTFIVSNCDILLDIDYKKLVERHIKEKNEITLVLLQKDYTIPYGVVDINKNGQVVGLREKPHLDFRLNTGVYVLEPNVIKKMTEQYVDMTDVIEQTLERGGKVGSYLVDEKSWMDIGEMDGLNRANER
ncbi:MAG: NTP transferase domain-containing protein [Lachnospiraceae bacterium]|nr:NTP transferase domain-containing protein [Lachnospiraceae bacterium]